MVRKMLFTMAVSFSCWMAAGGQDSLQDCTIDLNSNILVFKNSRFIFEFHWNNGDLQERSLTNLHTGHTWEFPDGGDHPDPDTVPLPKAGLRVYRVLDHPLYPDHLVGEVTTTYQDYEIRRSYRIYPGVSALAMDLSLKKGSGYQGDPDHPFDERILLPGKRWKVKSIEFFDRTDTHNNLVYTKESLSFSKSLPLRGNVLILTDPLSSEELFVIKEAPLGESQLLYPGSDFLVKGGELTIQNLGAFYPEVSENQWFRCYGYVIGPGGNRDISTLLAIRGYMKSIRKPGERGGEMIMLNTWGDRGQDGKISEVFAIRELGKGKELGITHLQLDDGWQQGLSKNSKSSGGHLWDQWSREDWSPHSGRFPSGLGPVAEVASSLGIGLGLWFHPSNAASYSNWETDAEIILDLYSRWNIRTFKIDGMELSDKNADIHMRNIFDTVTSRSNGEVLFNLDATAGRRGGYFYLNEYGNIFLENRYTDWGNYYPHWTLRNLWQLSRYVPPEKLQIEFLNTSRNQLMYDDKDPLRPSAVPFEYAFATTMAAQPLAWMESSALPDEAFRIHPVLESYKKEMMDFHRGAILPIGQEPDGVSWTGFQSITSDDSGFFLVYRENSAQESFEMQTYLPGDQRMELEAILGYGSNMECLTDHRGALRFMLPQRFSYGLFRYRILRSR